MQRSDRRSSKGAVSTLQVATQQELRACERRANPASYLLKRLLAVQAGSGDLRQQDGHVLLLLPQPDQPLPDVSIHHAQCHLLLPAQSLVEVCEVGPDTGAGALCCAGDLTRAEDQSCQEKCNRLCSS